MIINNATNTAITDKPHSQDVIAGPVKGNDDQLWTLEPAPKFGSSAYIFCAANKKAMDVAGG